MDGSHNALLDTKGVVQGLGQRGKAVGRAACVGDTLDVLGEHLVVDAHNDGGIDIVLGRDAEHHLAGAGFNMVGVAALRRRSRAKDAGRFQDHLDAHVLPGQLGGIPHGQHLDGFAVDDQFTVSRLDRSVPLAHDRIVFEQVGKALGVRKVIDSDEIQLALSLHNNSCDSSADSAEPVNCDLCCHRYFS